MNAALPGLRLPVQADFLILMDEIGSGSDTSIRVPQLGQCMDPECSSTLGTVVNIRVQLGHLTLMILTNDGS
jgi:hypothetical protein